ncbi:MAG: TrmH family RNA methyltransferase [Candidatus Shapirobacteria bacterium]|nr:TrmH family RNA methyltransferase [Candidatus Shapirobacteria bacterium]
MIKLNSHQLRASRVGDSQKLQKDLKRNPIIIVLDNVLDTYNIGTFFRLADAIAAEKLILCGPVVTPPNLKIHRSSIGTWKWIPWENCLAVGDCLKKLKQNGYQITAVEQAKNSINYLKAKYTKPVALVLGSEANGISAETLALCDQIVEIPMHGINKSLNVLVSASIITYDIVNKLL